MICQTTLYKFLEWVELGRFPITSFIKTQVLMYFVRINSNNINPLIKESLNVNLKNAR
jgi:hypothetical protein